MLRVSYDILHKLFSADWAKSLAAPAFVSEELKTMQMKDLADRLDKVSKPQRVSVVRAWLSAYMDVAGPRLSVQWTSIPAS